jgi:hypothetical protein
MIGLKVVYRYLKRFLLFWRDFLIGDDWWGAGIVLVGLALTYLAARYHLTAFWIPLVFVIASLAQNLWRTRRRALRAARRATGGVARQSDREAEAGGRGGGSGGPPPAGRP